MELLGAARRQLVAVSAKNSEMERPSPQPEEPRTAAQSERETWFGGSFSLRAAYQIRPSIRAARNVQTQL